MADSTCSEIDLIEPVLPLYDPRLRPMYNCQQVRKDNSDNAAPVRMSSLVIVPTASPTTIKLRQHSQERQTEMSMSAQSILAGNMERYYSPVCWLNTENGPHFGTRVILSNLSNT